MKMKFLMAIALVAVLAVAGFGLSACSSAQAQTTTPAQSTITTNTTGTANAAPLNVNVSGQQGIWVNGQGTVMVTPDIATVNLGVSAQAPTVAEAQSQAATAMNKIIAALTGNGVAQKDIQTQNFSIQQTYRYDNTTGQSIPTGFTVSNMVIAKIRTIDKAGTIIDAVAAAGGDLTRFNGVSFSVDNPQQYYSQARQAAMSDAQTKAQQLAQLAGVTLGKAYYISENASSPTPYPIYSSGLAVPAPSVTTPINPGQNQIILNVQVAYTIQ